MSAKPQMFHKATDAHETAKPAPDQADKPVARDSRSASRAHVDHPQEDGKGAGHHLRSAGRDGLMSHRCHAVGCDIEVDPGLLMCRRHWFQVPKNLRREVWRLYRKGQERDKNPSREYLAAAKDAIDAVDQAEHGGRLLL